MLVVCDLQEGETPVARVRRDGIPCRGSCCRAHLEGCSFGHERQRKKVRTLLESIFGGRAKTGLPLAGVWKVYSDWLEGSERVLADITLRQRRCVCARFVDWAEKNYPAVKTADQVDVVVRLPMRYFSRARRWRGSQPFLPLSHPTSGVKPSHPATASSRMTRPSTESLACLTRTKGVLKLGVLKLRGLGGGGGQRTEDRRR